jgi:hypothetical protein
MDAIVPTRMICYKAKQKSVTRIPSLKIQETACIKGETPFEQLVLNLSGDTIETDTTRRKGSKGKKSFSDSVPL